MNKRIFVLFLVILLVMIGIFIYQQVRINELERMELVFKEKFVFLFKAYSEKAYSGKDFPEEFWELFKNEEYNFKS